MRLYEVIDHVSQQLYQQAVQHIVQDCKPYLKAANVGQIRQIRLWRGMETAGAFQHKTTRRQRNPRDTHPVIHQTANQYFKDKFGIALRSEAVFVAADRLSAQRFGKPHLVFPTGSQWKMFGSPHVRDFTAYVNKELRTEYIPELFKDKVSKSKYSTPPRLTDEEQQQVEQAVKQILEQAQYQQIKPDQLAQFPETNEIMVVVDDYYAVVASYNDADDLYQMIDSHLQSQ